MVCQFPYDFESLIFYHCNKDYECQTENGFAKCNGGKFVAGQNDDTGVEYLARINFKTINLDRPGYYKVSVWAYMFCDGPREFCLEANDFLKFYFYKDLAALDSDIFKIDYSMLNESKEWKEFEFEILATKKELTVYENEVLIT